jgi:hypothetical protein
MRALTMDEQALVSGGDGICVNVDGNQIALGLGVFGTGTSLLTTAGIATLGAGTLLSGGTVLIVGGTALALALGGGMIMGAGMTVTTCKDDRNGGS